MRVSCVYATASRWGGPPVASEVRGDAAISTTPDAAPGLAARRRRILFVAEAVTLAHVVRPFALAQSLDPSRYEVHFACDPRYNQLLGPLPFRHHAIHTIPSERFFGDPGRCHRRCRRSGACARTRPAPAFCRGEERHGGSVTTRGCAVTASRTSWLPLAVHNPRFEGNPNLLLPSAVRWRCPEDAQPQAGSRMPGTEPQGCGARSSQRGRERGLTNCRSHVLSPLRPHQFS